MKQFKKINHKTQNISIKDILNMIDSGMKLQEIDDVSSLSDSEKLEYTDALILSPDYQREYRFTVKDESSLIESVILGIPIPPVFLSSDRYEGVKVLNVVDGQHRLRAFYRFCKDKYKLKGMKFLKDISDMKYSEIPFEKKEQILAEKLSAIVFEDFPGLEFELEIFNRYNKGTKPLSPQEIRHAVYNSRFNNYVNSFVKTLLNKKDLKLLQAYNVTKDRYQKKKVQESIFVILSILEYGINEEFNNSPIYAENYMKNKKILEETDEDKAAKNFNFVKKRFENFNTIIKYVCKKINYPFSKEIYGISSRNYKFQMSIAMIVAGVFHKIFESNKTGTELIQSNNIDKIIDTISVKLKDSYLEDPEYKASSTNSKKIKELVNDIELIY